MHKVITLMQYFHIILYFLVLDLLPFLMEKFNCFVPTIGIEYNIASLGEWLFVLMEGNKLTHYPCLHFCASDGQIPESA